MRNFFKRLRDSFRNRQKTKMRSGSAKGAMRRKGMTERTGFDAIKADIAGDFNPSKRDLDYQARLSDRQERSQQALTDMRERRDRRRKRRNNNDDDTTDTTTETTTTDDDTTDTTTTTLDENTNTALTNVENISDKTFNNTDDVTNYFDNTATSVNTAAGQEQNQASALTTSVGEAEDEAISYMTTGTGSNILTSAQGLLGGDDEDENNPFNRRKTLIGA
jgi:hypothetical protein